MDVARYIAGGLPPVARWFVSAAFVLGAGCQFGPQYPSPPSPRALPAPAVLDLLSHPKFMLFDYTHPPVQATQKFLWSGEPARWTLTLPREGYGYAGFRFRSAYDFTAVDRTRALLRFQLKPASAASFLYVALIDGDFVKPRVMTQVPLAGLAPSREGEAEVVIRLSEFPATGAGAPPRAEDDPTMSYPFDWSDVREVRFTCPSGGIRARSLSIRQLQLRHSGP